jgi:hypothetical protein
MSPTQAAESMTQSQPPYAFRVPARVTRLARMVVLALAIGLGIAYLYFAVTAWTMPDAGAYWEAALRLRAGEPLYPEFSNVEASEVYRYSPWFAWLAVPFSFLPAEVAGVVWSAILVAASCAAVVPLARRGAWLQVAFFWPILIGISANGNVHALMMAALVLGIERRSGPFWIAAAASLKAAPILLVLAYAARREWARVAWTCGLTAVLVAPFLLYDLSGYATDVGFAGLLIEWPPVYIAGVATAALISLRLGDSPLRWLAAATTVALALPRFFVYDVTLLLAGTPQRTERAPAAQESAAPPSLARGT